MPAYDYRCTNCSTVATIMKSISKLDKNEYCSACGSRQPMERLIGAPPAHVHAGTPRFHRQPAK